MRSAFVALASFTIATAIVLGCGQPATSEVCVPGARLGCACADGAPGSTVCQPDGRGFAACSCGPGSGGGGHGAGGRGMGGNGVGGHGGSGAACACDAACAQFSACQLEPIVCNCPAMPADLRQCLCDAGTDCSALVACLKPTGGSTVAAGGYCADVSNPTTGCVCLNLSYDTTRCANDSPCPAGQACENGSCAPSPCFRDAMCPSGSCCGRFCCPADQVCCDGGPEPQCAPRDACCPYSSCADDTCT